MSRTSKVILTLFGLCLLSLPFLEWIEARVETHTRGGYDVRAVSLNAAGDTLYTTRWATRTRWYAEIERPKDLR